ncbi:MAG: hypothetical protein AAFZ07_19160 [Actinomycetota bacterium]
MVIERLRGLMGRAPRHTLRRLPTALAVPALALREPPRADTADHRRIPLPEPLELEVYWLRSSGGTTGPAASVHLGIEELMRIDGLRGACHVHYDLAESRARGGSAIAARRRIADVDIAAWAADELRLNLRYAISLQRRRSRRALRPDPRAVDEAADRLRAEFEGLLARHGHEPVGR